MVYLHPILGAITVALAVFLGMQGLRSTHRAPYARGARRLHGRLAWGVYAVCVLALALGIGSTAWLRDDLDPATTLHFPAAVGLVGLMTVSAVTAKRLRAWSAAPRVHKWIGVALMAVAAAVAVLGMRLLP